jgi:hypothetical protein
MAAITLGLVEVEERLQTLRRRLNGYTVLQAASVSLSVIILAVTGLLVLGLRPAVFNGPTVSVAALAVAAALGSVLFVRRRWMDILATAAVADQRGQLTDRLTTLVDLRLRPRPSRLAPVLVAQTLALGERWRVPRIMPRRFPRSVFCLLASLLLLAVSPLIAPQPPAVVASPPVTGGAAVAAGQSVSIEPARLGQTSGDGLTIDAMGGLQVLPNAAASADSAAAGTLTANDAPAPPHSDGLVGLLPNQLQHALRSVFKRDEPEKSGLSRAHAERSGGTGEPGANHVQGRPEDTQHHGWEDQGKGDAPGEPRAQHARQPGQSKSDEQVAQRPDASNPDPNFEGSSPAAGTGASPNALLGSGPGEPMSDPNAPKTFKLTITSFLHAIEQNGAPPRQPGKRAAGAAAATGSAAQPLSERQLADDVLRKAEIPPEYEDVVRRVYSLRADQ